MALIHGQVYLIKYNPYNQALRQRRHIKRGKKVVSLNGDVEPMLHGMGGDIPLLPSENYAATHYESVQDAPTEEVPVDPVEGIGSDLAPVDLSGIEEAAIV